jgi:Flp pilus assembly protein TadG
MRLRRQPRRGTTMVEFAVISSVTVLILIGLLAFGLRIFCYQQVARVARDASRWASVHGTGYAQATGNSAATAAVVYNNAIVPNAQGLNLSNLTYSVTWNTSNSPYHTVTVSGVTKNVANTVTVAINYSCLQIGPFAALTVSSTSTTPMSF